MTYTKPRKVADCAPGINRYEVRAIPRQDIPRIERAMWLDHGRELGDGEYGEPDIAGSMHYVLTEVAANRGWHVASFDELPYAINVAHGCNRSDARAVYYVRDTTPDAGRYPEGPALPPDMERERWVDSRRRMNDLLFSLSDAISARAYMTGVGQTLTPHPPDPVKFSTVLRIPEEAR